MKKIFVFLTFLIFSVSAFSQNYEDRLKSSRGSSVNGASGNEFSRNSATKDFSKISSANEFPKTSATNDFTNRVQVAMSNPDYVVTPGDVYSLNYAAGSTMVSYTIPVDSTYKIRVSNLAVLDVRGKTYLTLKKEIENIVVRNYPMSGVQFVLLNPSSFTVVVTGEVSFTTERSVWSLSRVSEVCSETLTPYSSLRNVTVKSADGTVKNLDLFKAHREGDFSQNPYLRPGDTIIINRMDRSVTITGSVERPGTYELLKGENLKQLVEYYANGLTDTANIEKIEFVRSLYGESKSGNKVYLDSTAIENDYELKNGDSVNVTSNTSLMPTIIVEGIINNPVENPQSADTVLASGKDQPLDTSYRTYVRFHSGENYATLIRRISDMFNSYSDLKNSYFERNGEKISLNIEHILYDAELMSDKTVMANDHLVIPFQQHLQNVLVTGEVKNVVEVTAWPLQRLSEIIKEHLTDYSSTRDVIVKALTGEQHTYDLYKATRFGDMTQDPYVRSGETIYVNRIDRRVTISGAVERPGTYQLMPGENLDELIKNYGGGLAPLADVSRIELNRVTSEKSKSGEIHYINLDANPSDKNYELVCYDQISVSSYSNLQPVMFVEGAVGEASDEKGIELASTNRITVQFTTGENYASLIRANSGWFQSVSDTANSYLIRGEKIIPINLNEILYDASFYSDLTVEPNDILNVPFRQFFVTVAGAVNAPGRFPFIPDRDFEYYVGLAGGFDRTRNNFKSVDIVDMNGKELSKKDKILPESTITANTNATLYYFNQYAPVVTTILSLIATSISVLAVTGAL